MFWKVVASCVLLFTLALVAAAQQPGDTEFAQAYKALASKDYDTAIDLFRSGLSKQPQNAGVHKDLAYTLLKTGENGEARDQFAEAMRLNASDESATLEYAFLCYETKMPIQARRTFDRLRKRGSSTTRATAEQAFQNIDAPLAAGIARWEQALAEAPNPLDRFTFTAHLELARLAEQRDNLELAATQFEICRKIRPDQPEFLLDLARVWRQLNRLEDARAAGVAASRSIDARTAERALDQEPARYPYPYEFVNAIRLDPKNVALRRELAYLYLAMNRQPEAIEQFRQIAAIDPKDPQISSQLAAILGFKSRPGAPAATITVAQNNPAVDPKTMGIKSLAAGYVKDAIRYLRQAHEEDPNDAQVMLKLGWAYNMAKQDADAIQWFDRARQSDDPAIAAEANKAWHNLEGGGQPLLTIWALPMYSSRWNDLFTYGQVKRVVPLPWRSANKLFSLYLSARFLGDARGGLAEGGGIEPQYLSESSVILGAGIASRTWHHLTGWAEAGESMNYLPGRTNEGIAIPDYRGGLNFAKGFGHLLGSNSSGVFYETTADAVYISRYQKDWLFYSQHRAGRTFHLGERTYVQALFNVNYTHDLKNQYWANTLEMGPGLRLRFPWMPSNVYFATDFLRGVYTNNVDNPRPPHYDDIRVGLWYAVSK
ncbi:MAG: tetratricopeptide repeat protein [Bryobacteraceae bacterium]